MAEKFMAGGVWGIFMLKGLCYRILYSKWYFFCPIYRKALK